jgi:hypothetical protein
MEFFYPKFNDTTHKVSADSINSDQYPYNASYSSAKTFMLKEGAEVCAVRENIGYRCEWSEVLVIDTALSDAEYYNKRVYVKNSFLSQASSRKTFVPICSDENSIDVRAQEIDPNLKEIFVPYIDKRNGFYSIRIQTDYEKILDSLLFDTLVNDVLYEGVSILLSSRGFRSDNKTIEDLINKYCTFAYVQNDFDVTINRKCEPITFTVSIPLAFFNELPEINEEDDTAAVVTNTISFTNKDILVTVNDIIRMIGSRASDIIGITYPNLLIENFIVDFEISSLRAFATSLSNLLESASPEFKLRQDPVVHYSFGLDKGYNLVRVEAAIENDPPAILKKDQVSRFKMTGAFHNKRIFNYLLKSGRLINQFKDINNKILPLLEEFVDFPKVSLVNETITINGKQLSPETLRQFRVAFSNSKEGCLDLRGATNSFSNFVDVYSDPVYHIFAKKPEAKSGSGQVVDKDLKTLLNEAQTKYIETDASFAVNIKTLATSTAAGAADALKQQFPANINTLVYAMHRLNINRIIFNKIFCLLKGLDGSDPQTAALVAELPDQIFQYFNYLYSIKGLEGAEYAKAVANGLNINQSLFCIQNQDLIYFIKGLTAVLKIANFVGNVRKNIDKVRQNIINITKPGQKINPYAQLGRAMGSALSQAAVRGVFEYLKILLDTSCEDALLNDKNTYENLFGTNNQNKGYGGTSNSDKNTLTRNRGNALDDVYGTTAELQYGFDRQYVIDLLDLLFNDINCILTPAESVSLLTDTPSDLTKTLVRNIIRNKYYTAPNDLSFMLDDDNKLFGFFKRLGASIDEAGIADALKVIVNPISPSNICSPQQTEARNELIKGKLPKNFDILDRQLKTRTLKAKTLLDKIRNGEENIDLNPLCDIDSAAKDSFVTHMTQNYYNLLEDTFKSPLSIFNDEANLLPSVYENKRNLIRTRDDGTPIGSVEYINYNEGLYHNLSTARTLKLEESPKYKELYLPIEHENTAAQLSLALLPTDESESRIDVICNPDLIPDDKKFEQTFLSEGSDQADAMIWMEVFNKSDAVADFLFDTTTQYASKSDLNEMYDPSQDPYNSRLAETLRNKPYFIAISVVRNTTEKHEYVLKFVLNDTYNKQFRILATTTGSSDEFGNDAGNITNRESFPDGLGNIADDIGNIYGITKFRYYDAIRSVGKAAIYGFYREKILPILEKSKTLEFLLENLRKFNDIGLFNIETQYDKNNKVLTKTVNIGTVDINNNIQAEQFFKLEEAIADTKKIASIDYFNQLSQQNNDSLVSDKSLSLFLLRGTLLSLTDKGQSDVGYIKSTWYDNEFTYVQNSKGPNPGKREDSPRYDGGPSISNEELDAYAKPREQGNNPYGELFSKLTLINRPKNPKYKNCNIREHYLNFDFFRDRYLKALEIQLCDTVADTADIIKKLASEMLIRELVTEILLKALPYFGSMSEDEFTQMYKNKTYRNIVAEFVLKEIQSKFANSSDFTGILSEIYTKDEDTVKKSAELVELTGGDSFDYYIAREIKYFTQYCIKYAVIKFSDKPFSDSLREKNAFEFLVNDVGLDNYYIEADHSPEEDIITYSGRARGRGGSSSQTGQLTGARSQEFTIQNASSVFDYLDNEYQYALIYFILHSKLKHEINAMFVGTKDSLVAIILQNIQGAEQTAEQQLEKPDYQDINNFIYNLAYSPNPAAMIALRPEYSRYIKYFLTAALAMARSQTLTIAKTMDPNIMLTRVIGESLATIGMLSWSLIPQETRTNLIRDSNEFASLLTYKRLEDGRSLSPDLTTSGLISFWLPPTPVGIGYLVLDTLQEYQYYANSMTEIRQLKDLKPKQDPCEITTSPNQPPAQDAKCTVDKRIQGLEDINSIEPEYDKV